MDLVLAALPDTGLAEVAKILQRAYAVRIETVETDLTAVEAAQQLANQALARGFEVDTLINNAGVGFTGRFTLSSPAQNETTVQLNVAATLRLTQVMLPRLLECPAAWILNVASLGALYPMPSMPVYSATKRFLLDFTALLRTDLRGSGVSVSALCPNGIRTNRGACDLIDRQGLAGRLTCRYPDEVARAGIRGLLARRAVIVPGAVNRFLAWLSPWVPRGLYMNVISRRWGTARKIPASSQTAVSARAARAQA
jgi:hypothetical protein